MKQLVMNIEITAVSVFVMDTNLKLIKNNMTHEERMMHRIRALYRDLESGDGDVSYIHDILIALEAYLFQFEDEDIIASTYKIREATFYIDNFLRT